MEYHIIKSSNFPISEISPRIPTEYMSVANIRNIVINDNQMLSILGLGYINNVNMGANVTKQFKLILIDKENYSAVPYIFDMKPTTGNFNPSLGSNDYTHAWFNETNIDFSQVAAGNYKMFLYIRSNDIMDVVEFRDFSFWGDFAFDNSSRNFLLKMNPERRNYDLVIADKSVTTP